MFTLLFSVLFLTIALLNPQTVLAHGIGQTYTLPLPLWLYLWASAAVVLLSFIVISAFFGKAKSNDFKKPQFSVPIPGVFKIFARVLSLFLLFLIIISGVFGSQYPSLNFSPNFFWSVFIIFFVVSSAMFGNWWQFLNPVKITYTLLSKVSKNKISLNVFYPKILSFWPAVLFYFAFIWVELVSGFSDRPRLLSILIALYATFLLWGMSLYGEIFLKKAGFLTVFASLLSRISLFEYRKSRLFLVNPLKKITSTNKIDFSLAVFIILTLAGVAFDSFSESPVFYSIAKFFGIGNIDYELLKTIGLTVMVLPFITLYFLFLYLGNLVVVQKYKLSDLASYFAISLVPISVAYYIAHFYPLFIVGAQNVARISAGLLGFKISETARANLALIDPGLVWYLQIVIIIAGHVLAVLFAHQIALKIYKMKKDAIIAQFPITALMVTYTVFSLWLLSQPIVVSP